MALDSVSAELRDLREIAYLARRKARDAQHTDDHVNARDLTDQTERYIEDLLDGLSRLDRIIRSNLEPLLHRTDHIGDEARLADAIERLDVLEARLRSLEHNDNQSSDIQ
jgi:hypothetical protein